jgi:hypothetical protein
MKRILLLAPVAAVLLLACGGGHSDSPAAAATSLQYTNPAGTSGDWKLLRNAGSTSTHLVLDLVGPSDGTKYRGVGFTLQADPALVTFSRLKDADGQATYGLDLGVLQDRTLKGDPITPDMQVSAVKDGRLMAGIFQKNDEHSYSADASFWTTAKDCSAPVYQIAIDLDPALKALPGAVPLTVLKARVLPEDISTVARRRIQDATLAVGTLELK